MTIIARSLLLNSINSKLSRPPLIKKFALILLNGTIWGCLAGSFAYLLYKSTPLALATTATMLLTAWLIGRFSYPYQNRQKFGFDPASSSKVLLSAITTGGSLFIFLWMTIIFLID